MASIAQPCRDSEEVRSVDNPISQGGPIQQHRRGPCPAVLRREEAEGRDRRTPFVPPILEGDATCPPALHKKPQTGFKSFLRQATQPNPADSMGTTLFLGGGPGKV